MVIVIGGAVLFFMVCLNRPIRGEALATGRKETKSAWLSGHGSVRRTRTSSTKSDIRYCPEAPKRGKLLDVLRRV